IESRTPGTDEQKQQQIKDIEDLNKQNNALSAKNANIELQIEMNTAADKQKIAQDTLDKKMKAIDKVAAYEKQVQETVSAFVKAGYEYELNAIQKKIDINNKLKETETTRISTSTLSQTEQAAALTRLNLQTQAQNEA